MNEHLWYVLGALALGQLVSLSMTGASFASSALSDKGVDAPVTQSLIVYILLALIYGGVLLYRGKKLQVPWYWYILLAFVDVEGNFLVVKAYQYTSITSVTLLDCWTIPWVMILTCFFIKTKYTPWQFAGAVICIVGLVLVLFSDASTSDSGGSKPILGDTLVIAGTIFYAMSNVGEEFCVKKKDRVEVVAMLGVFGALISTIQLLIFERKELESLDWSYTIVLLFLGFGLSMFAFYTGVPFLLKVDWLYYVAFGVVVVGLTIYSIYSDKESTILNVSENDPGESIPYTHLNQERDLNIPGINVTHD